MPWQQLTVRVVQEKVAKVESLLELAGALSLSLEDAAGAPLFEPDPGDTPLWSLVSIKALFDEQTDAARLHAWLRGALGGEPEVTVERVAEESWRERTRPISPRRIGRLWLVPAEHAEAERRGTTLKLHQGLAFGTGEHPTTALCLEWLEAEMAPGGVVLDYGCGSGVLALAALRLGADRAFAVDIDPQALAATVRNAALNGLDGRLWIGTPERLPAIRVDVLLANILARPLIDEAAFLAARLATGGRAVLSGVLASQRTELLAAYAPCFDQVSVAERDGWIRFAGRKRI